MMKFVETALIDADIILYVTDVKENPEKNSDYITRIKTSGIPVIVLINKIDLSNQVEVMRLFDYWSGIFPGSPVFSILDLLPESPPYFSKDDLTDRNERFFMQEIIREKILLYYQKEIPYSSEVEVEEFREENGLLRIRSVIYVERDSQKGIIIGKGGAALKKVGTEARQEAEEFFGKKIFLELYVKVAREWRDKDSSLRRFGYNAE
jgi:GTP-binding protein Era